MSILLFLLFAVVPTTHVAARTVTISNVAPRRDTDGNIVNAHSGNIVKLGDTYFLYGEYYGVGHFQITNTHLPRLSVYTSPDLTTWTFKGLLHNNTSPGWAASGNWPGAATDTGGWWCPTAVFDDNRKKMVLWFTSAPGACCDAYWGVAESDDGIHFDLITLNETGTYPRKRSPQVGSHGASVDPNWSISQPQIYQSKDGSAVFIDDDGTGYIVYTIMNPGQGHSDHVVTIERLTPDLQHSTGVQVTGLFPDDFVEGSMLFKRRGIYYVIYSSCCCACRQGSGAVVYQARNISGPWVRQQADVNCRSKGVDGRPAPICAGMPGRDRPNDIIVPAQGMSTSVLPGGDGEQIFLWNGDLWLSGPNNPPNCTSLCGPATGVCAQPPGYTTGHDFSYWIPLRFDDQGNVEQFEPFQDEFQIDIV